MIKNIFFDFDGVILESMSVRDFGFRKIFECYPSELVEKLIDYNNINGGLSRFHKIKYFYNEILMEDVSKEKIQKLAQSFSQIMKIELIKKKYIIEDTMNFIQTNNQKYIMHIVSGSEENELRYLCDQLEISKYFKSINGSPNHKNKLVKECIEKYIYDKSECVLIGDSINDYEAAKINEIIFVGYNNINLINIDCKYVYNMDEFDRILERFV